MSSTNLSSKAASPMVDASHTTTNDAVLRQDNAQDGYEAFNLFQDGKGLRAKSGFFDEGSFTLAKQALSRKRLVATE